MLSALKRLGSKKEAGDLGGGSHHKRNPSSKRGKERLRLLQEEQTRADAVRAEHDQLVRVKERDADEKQRQMDEVIGKTEVSTNRVDFQHGVMGLVDRMEAHPAGKLFGGAVVSNKPPPDRSLTLSKLRTYQAPNDMSRLVLGDIDPIDLKGNVVDISLTEAMSPRQFKDLKPYCLVSDVFIHYIPMDTFYTMSFPVDFYLNDFRKVEDNTVRHYPLSHSVGYNLLFTLDYCVRKEDLKLLTLAISSGINTFRPGIAWGTVKIVVSLISMDFPIKANMQKTLGVMHLADSDLQDFVSDPRRSDGVLTPESLKLLKSFYKRGDIENILQPLDDTKGVNTAATVMNHVGPESDVADLMRDMREEALRRAREGVVQQSQHPEGEKKRPQHGSPKKGALKTPGNMVYTPRPMSPSSDSHDDGRGKMDTLADVEAGESMSQVGSSDTETIDRPFSPVSGNKDKETHRFRSVNFGGLN